MKIKNRALSTFGALLIGIAAASTSSAQNFPEEKPVKIVVATNPGGLTDTLGRILADFLQKRLGQAVVVENRPGASGTIGATYVASADPDGYTLLLGGAEQAVAPAVRPELPYKFEDFTFLIRPFTADSLILASPHFAPNTVQELVEYMKANPGRVRYGTTGVGAIVHLGIAMFESATDVKGVQVPYTGIAPVYQDLIAGNIDITGGGNFPFPENLKVLANARPNRSILFPDVPTLQEVGIEGADWGPWYGFLAPAGLPQPIADKLIAEIQAVIQDPVAIEKFKVAAKNEPQKDPLIGDAFKQQALREVEGWTTVARENEIVIQQ